MALPAASTLNPIAVPPEANGALWHPSPNFGPRRGRDSPDMVVIHYTAMETAEAALERLSAPEHEVSAHYLIAEDGRLWQMVREADRAWHAGAGAWGRVTDVNSHSLGIELANTGAHPFSEPQMAVLERLLADILQRWNIPPARVIGHQDMAPERKSDPGRRFDWRRLALAGLAVWPEPGDASELSVSLDRIGFPSALPEARLAAFRARVRPWADGAADDTDRRLAASWAARWPVDGTGRMA